MSNQSAELTARVGVVMVLEYRNAAGEVVGTAELRSAHLDQQKQEKPDGVHGSE
jgi:hypothetical protein